MKRTGRAAPSVSLTWLCSLRWGKKCFSKKTIKLKSLCQISSSRYLIIQQKKDTATTIKQCKALCTEVLSVWGVLLHLISVMIELWWEMPFVIQALLSPKTKWYRAPFYPKIIFYFAARFLQDHRVTEWLRLEGRSEIWRSPGPRSCSSRNT